jgi:uncharacterized protein (TIGR02145 family)
MRKKVNGKRLISKLTLFVSAVLLMTVTFHSCQQDEIILESEEMGLKSSLISEIVLNYPDEVNVGKDFDITFSSTCGRIMVERGFIGELDENGIPTNKVYTGLTCDMENLMWESVGEDVYEDCGGKTITENLSEPGTYVYRAKLNFKAVKKSGCPDCGDLAGNRVECFMITVIESSNDTFTDPRDGMVYKIVTIGTQTWMAENLAYNGKDAGGNILIPGIYAYDNNESYVSAYGRLYKWNAAMASCPAGWHLPTNDEWNTLFNYLAANGHGYEGNGDYIGKALAAPGGWEYSPYPGYPGNDQTNNNSSGFSAIPGGERDPNGYFWYLGRSSIMWSATKSSDVMGSTKEIAYYYPGVYHNNYIWIENAYSVRCVKDAE